MEELLKELFSRKVRLWIYFVILVLSLALAAWQASEGNWLTFAGALLGAFQSSLSIKNINPEVLSKASDAALLNEAIDRGKTVVDLQHYQWVRAKAMEANGSPDEDVPDGS